MRERGALWLVVARELRESARSRTFWAILAVAAVASTAAVILPEVLGGDRDTYAVGVVGGDERLDGALRAAEGPLDADLEVRAVESAALARSQVDDGELDVAAIAGDSPQVIARDGEADRLVAVAQQALASEGAIDRMGAAGLSDAQVAEVLDGPTVEEVRVDTQRESRRGTAAVIAIVLYLLLLMLTIQVANGVAIEKANRISEVLLAIVRPRALLFGKVVGVGLVGFLTLLVGATPVLVKQAIGGSLPAGLPVAIAAGSAWFLLGLALYLTIAGSLGALVERQEEAGAAVAPLTFILIGAYLVGQTAADTTLGSVLAVFPLTAPLVMPSRIAIGAATPAEVAASLLLGVLTVGLAVRVGATVYRRAIVRTGRRLSVREALRRA